jgi:hypothetical protein
MDDDMFHIDGRFHTCMFLTHHQETDRTLSGINSLEVCFKNIPEHV